MRHLVDVESKGILSLIMQIKIIAVGSTKWDRFWRRWGVSFLIGEDVLFDTFGDPGVFLRNMRRFGVDVSKIKHIVLSHDDWDHITGLWHLLGRRKDASVYICPGFQQDIKERIASFGVRVIESGPLTEIRDGVFISGEMRVSCDGRDIFEQALIVKFLKKLTVITGCAHPGLINVVDAVQNLFSKEKVACAIGGFHLKDVSEAEVQRVVAALRERGVSKVAPTHCTGKSATEALKKEYGIDFLNIQAGSVIEV